MDTLDQLLQKNNIVEQTQQEQIKRRFWSLTRPGFAFNGCQQHVQNTIALNDEEALKIICQEYHLSLW